MAIEIAEVIETGPGWNRVRGTDGNIYTLQGDYNWRSNNPGNIEYGDFAISQGAIGSGAVPKGRERGFAIFPTLSAGEEARRALQFESPRYRDLTIEQAISRYAPPNENDTRGYINAVTRAAGVPAGTKMSDLTPQQQTAFLAAQSQMEGMRQGDILNAQGIRLPPNEIPNMVGTALSVVPTPSVAPTPATISPDLSLMRNPQMSSSARMAQVTPPLPQPRPASPMDIARAPGTTVATIPTSTRPGQSQIERITPMPSAREIAMAPGTTIATIPTTPRASLPALPRTIPGQSQIERTMPSAREIASAPGTTIATIPTSGIGQPPATRTVPSVPYTLQPTAREIAQAPGTTIATIPTTTRPNAAQINDAARRASLTATQGYVDRALPSVPTAVQATARTAPIGSSAQNIAAQRAEQLSQRPTGPYRLAPGPIGLTPNTNGVRLNQPPIQVVPSPMSSAVPLPRRRPATPIAPMRQPVPMPQMAYSPSPLRVTVNGANSYSAPRPPPMTPVQALQAQGMSAAQAYDAANASARGAPSLEDRVRGGTSGGGDSGYRIAMDLPQGLLAQLMGGGFVART